MFPDNDHPYGLIRFDRSVRALTDDSSKTENGSTEVFKEFGGEGFSLRKGRK